MKLQNLKGHQTTSQIKESPVKIFQKDSRKEEKQTDRRLDGVQELAKSTFLGLKKKKKKWELQMIFSKKEFKLKIYKQKLQRFLAEVHMMRLAGVS